MLNSFINHFDIEVRLKYIEYFVLVPSPTICGAVVEGRGSWWLLHTSTTTQSFWPSQFRHRCRRRRQCLGEGGDQWRRHGLLYIIYTIKLVLVQMIVFISLLSSFLSLIPFRLADAKGIMWDKTFTFRSNQHNRISSIFISIYLAHNIRKGYLLKVNTLYIWWKFSVTMCPSI